MDSFSAFAAEAGYVVSYIATDMVCIYKAESDNKRFYISFERNITHFFEVDAGYYVEYGNGRMLSNSQILSIAEAHGGISGGQGTDSIDLRAKVARDISQAIMHRLTGAVVLLDYSGILIQLNYRGLKIKFVFNRTSPKKMEVTVNDTLLFNCPYSRHATWWANLLLAGL